MNRHLLDYVDYRDDVMATIRDLNEPDSYHCLAFNHHNESRTQVVLTDVGKTGIVDAWDFNYAIGCRSNASLNWLKTETINDLRHFAEIEVKVLLRDGEKFVEFPGNEDFTLPAFHLTNSLFNLMQTTSVTQNGPPIVNVALGIEMETSFVAARDFFFMLNDNKNLSATTNRRLLPTDGPLVRARARLQEEVFSEASEISVLRQIRRIVGDADYLGIRNYTHACFLFLRQLWLLRTLTRPQRRGNALALIASITRLLKYFDSDEYICHPPSYVLTRVVMTLKTMRQIFMGDLETSFEAFNLAYEYELPCLRPLSSMSIQSRHLDGKIYAPGELDIWVGRSDLEVRYHKTKVNGIALFIDGLVPIDM